MSMNKTMCESVKPHAVRNFRRETFELYSQYKGYNCKIKLCHISITYVKSRFPVTRAM